MTRRPREDGFTLIELLIGIVILGIIMSAISSAFIVFLRTSESALGRDDHSAGGALLASYLDRDLASADAVQADALSANDSHCSVAGVFGPRLRLAWNERRATSPDDATIVVGDQWRVTYARTGDLLVRKLCPPSGSPVVTTIVSALPAASLLSISTAGSCGAADRTRVVVSLPGFADDVAQPYQYGGCVRGRTA